MLTAKVSSPQPESVQFTLQGNVAVPQAGGVRWISVCGSLTAEAQPDGSYSIIECAAEATISCLEFADGITLTNGRLLLAGCREKTEIHLHGNVRYTSLTDIESGGVLDAQIMYHCDHPACCAFSTLINNAYLTLGPTICLKKGTVRFELFSMPDIKDAFSRQFNEDNELLFQFEEPVRLQPLSIEGIPGKPITMAVELQPSATTPSSLLLHIFPARLKSEYIGDETVLFLHGKHYDEPFTINTSGAWNAFLSSNVFMHLVAPDDPSGKALLKSAVMLHGTLSGNNLDSATILLHSTAEAQGTAFPESSWPQEVPCQMIELSVLPDGKVDFALKLNAPVIIDNRTRLFPANGSKTIRGKLCREGFAFRRELVLASDESDDMKKRHLTACIINSDCRISNIVQT
ncbi:MAG: hypothetical protein JW913_19520 [Chitinispirillaceae bacterium]|nr:hypothetical protein [Chitinispirillaceae bacterium]